RQDDVIVPVVVARVLGTVGRDDAEALELLDALTFDARRRGHLLERHLQAGRGIGELLRRLRPVPVGRHREVLALAVARVQALLDHLEREVLIALHAQDRFQLVDVLRVELPVARRRPLRFDEALGLQEPDLRDRDVGEFRLDRHQHLADRLVVARPRHGHDSPAAKNSSLNLPIWTSSFDASFVSSTCSPFTYVPFRLPTSRTKNAPPCRTNSACLRETVMSSRKTSLSVFRPAVVTSFSRRNVDPAFGPRFTRSRPCPGSSSS